MDYKEVIQTLYGNKGLSKAEIGNIEHLYHVYWEGIIKHLSSLDYDADIGTKEEFDSMLPQVNITRIGKLGLRYKVWKRIQNNKRAKHKSRQIKNQDRKNRRK